MYMRFVIPQINRDSGQLQGVFVTAYALLREGNLGDEEEETLQILLNWFEANLPIPHSVEITRRATFWYKASAQQCIGRMWELVNLLRAHGYVVELQTCQRLCNVRYRDEYQVASFPHRQDSPRRSKII